MYHHCGISDIHHRLSLHSLSDKVSLLRIPSKDVSFLVSGMPGHRYFLQLMIFVVAGFCNIYSGMISTRALSASFGAKEALFDFKALDLR